MLGRGRVGSALTDGLSDVVLVREMCKGLGGMDALGLRFLLCVLACCLLQATLLRAQTKEGPLGGSAGDRIYVDVRAGARDPDGSSWKKAYRSLSEALRAASENSEVWVAGGVYRPEPATTEEWPRTYLETLSGGHPIEKRLRQERYRAFILKSGVKMYGGFRGGVDGETSIYERDIASNPTTLEGDVGLRGIPYDNSFHVVMIPSDASGKIVIDGFTIARGDAISYSLLIIPPNEIYVNSSAGSTFDNVSVANYAGTAIQVGGGEEVHVSNCHFTENGGDDIFLGDQSSISSYQREGKIRRRADFATELYVYNNLFTDGKTSTVSDARATIAQGGYINAQEGRLYVAHNTFRSGKHAGIFLAGGVAGATTIANNIFEELKVAVDTEASVLIANNMVKNYNSVRGAGSYREVGGVVGLSPAYLSLDPTSRDFLRPTRYSPTVNAGSEAYVLDFMRLDRQYNTRPFSGSSPDVGAYEHGKNDIVQIAGYEPVDFDPGGEITLYGSGFEAGDLDAHSVVFAGSDIAQRPKYVSSGTIRVVVPFNALSVVAVTLPGGGRVEIARRFLDKVYVDMRIPPGGDGTTWRRAIRLISHAVGDRSPSNTHFWVARGAHNVNNDPVFSATLGGPGLRLISGQKLYGGFSGVETELSQRDPKRNVTSLVGVKSPDIGITADYASYLLLVENASGEVVVDGFTLRSSKLRHTSTSIFSTWGLPGTIRISGVSDFTMSNCIITDNTSEHVAGLHITGETKYKISNCLIHHNSENPVHHGTPAGLGAGVHIDTDLPARNVIINTTIAHNTSKDERAYNQTTRGAGLYINSPEDGQVKHLVVNTVVYKNRADESNNVRIDVPPEKLRSEDVSFKSCLIENASGDLLNVVNKDDVFDTRPSFISENVSSDYYMVPSPGSPLVDAGDDESFIQYSPNSRIKRDLSWGAAPSGDHVDVGAYEHGSALKFSVASFSPSSGVLGDQVRVRVSGEELLEDVSLYEFFFTRLFDRYVSVQAQDVDFDQMLFTLVVPQEAISGPIRLVYAGFSSYSRSNFVVKKPSVYVDASVQNPGNGGTWETARSTVYDALLEVHDGGIIRVAAGEYITSDRLSYERSSSLLVDKSVSLYGGYPPGGGTEEERDFVEHKTVLSGKGVSFGLNDNTHRILHVNAPGGRVLIDGFEISGAVAHTAKLSKYRRGAGITFSAGDLTLSRCVIKDNVAHSAPVLSMGPSGRLNLVQCLIYDNAAYAHSSAVSLDGISAVILNCTFFANQVLLSSDQSWGPQVVVGEMQDKEKGCLLANTIFYTNEEHDLSTSLQNTSFANKIDLINVVGYRGVKGIQGDINDDAIVVNFVESSPDAFHSTDSDEDKFLAPSPTFYRAINTGTEQEVYEKRVLDFTPLLADKDIYGNQVPYGGRIDIGAIEYTDPHFVKIDKVYPEDGVLSDGEDVVVEGTGFDAPRKEDYRLRLPGIEGDFIASSIDISDSDVQRLTFKFIFDVSFIQGVEGDLELKLKDGRSVHYAYVPTYVGDEIFVDASVAKSGDGFTWEDAYKTLSEALREAPGNALISVAEGEYYPTNEEGESTRSSSFRIEVPLKIYGGYPKGGGERDIQKHETILSGDVGTKENTSDNVFRVVTVSPDAFGVLVLSGLTVSGGQNSDKDLEPTRKGAGIYIPSGGSLSRVVIEHCTIKDNHVTGLPSYGGGLFVEDTPEKVDGEFRFRVIYSDFLDNSAGLGGGIHVMGDIRSGKKDGGGLELIYSVLVDNHALLKGGGLATRSALDVINCTIYRNESDYEAGAIHVITGEEDKDKPAIGDMPVRIDNSLIASNRGYLRDSPEVVGDPPRQPLESFESQISFRHVLLPASLEGKTGDHRLLSSYKGIALRNTLLHFLQHNVANAAPPERCVDAPVVFASTESGDEHFLRPISTSSFVDLARTRYLPSDVLKDKDGLDISRVALDAGAYEFAGGLEIFIEDFEPNPIRLGDILTIKGLGFDASGLKNNVVVFPAMNASEGGGSVLGDVRSVAKDEIRVIVPSFAISGRFRLLVNGKLIFPAEELEILTVAITSVEPSEALVGDEVTVKGIGFSANPEGNNIIFSGGARGRVVRSSPVSVIVEVPEGAQHGELLFRVGNSDFPSDVVFSPLYPRITSMRPLHVAQGERVTIAGLNFDEELRGNRIFFEGRFDPVYPEGNRISRGKVVALTVVVPAGAISGAVKLVVNTTETISSQFLNVQGPGLTPVIKSIEPFSAYRGDRIVLEGSFSSLHNTVVFSTNETPSGLREVTAFPASTTTRLEVIVPNDAEAGNVEVISSGHERVVSTSVFTPLLPKIVRVVPDSGPPGAEVTVIGAGFDREKARNKILLRGKEVAVVLAPSEDYLRFEIPSNAETGPVSVQVSQSRHDSDIVFEVRGPLTVARMSPNAGEVFSPINLIGTGFSDSNAGTRVEFSDGAGGYVPAQVFNSYQGGALARVPRGAYTGKLRVTVGHQVVETLEVFTVFPPEQKRFAYGVSHSMSGSVLAYPNPVRDKVSISAAYLIDKVVFYDVLMRRLREVLVSQRTIGVVSLDVSALSRGVYWLELRGLRGEEDRVRVIK